MYILIGIIVLVLSVVAVVTLLVLHYMHKGMDLFRKMFSGEFTDEEVERLSQKHYRARNDQQFGEEYFKRSSVSVEEPFEQPQQKAQYRKSSTTTATPEGVTIIDERSTNRNNRKIFQDDEGEYVDFSEA